MTSPIFDRTFDPRHGACVELTPTIRRVVAANASAFTFHGTGTYILGRGKVAVIDPGPLREDHLQALLSALEGEEVEAILITHTHLDHSPLAARLKEITGAPTYGYGPHGVGRTGSGHNRDAVEEGADWDFIPDIALKDGALVEGSGWTVESVYTPGHTSNHLCFSYTEEDALFSGDHVMGWSTSIISPPDGDMAAYMSSLERLLGRRERIYYPTHGNPIHHPKRHVESFIAHRRDREEQIQACLAEGIETVVAMVPAMYRDVPVKLYPAAARSVLAHLIHMTTEGRIACNTDVPGLQSRYSLP